MLFGRAKKNAIKIADKGVVEWKYAACGYCSTGCSIEVGLNAEGKPVSSRGVADADVNRGKLCLKGIFEHELFTSAGRGLLAQQGLRRTCPRSGVGQHAANGRSLRTASPVQTRRVAETLAQRCHINPGNDRIDKINPCATPAVARGGRGRPLCLP